MAFRPSPLVSLLAGLWLALSLAAGQALARGESAHAGLPAQCASIIPPIASGYGAHGPFRVERKTVANPEWRREPVTVLFPVGYEGRPPVVFFSHGFGQIDVETGYPKLIEHMVSRGNIVVYSPYPRLGSKERFYRILWAGFEAAAKAFGNRMDLARVGFVGHSFGAGATPYMAYRGLVENRWGSQGAFIFLMAPWYAYQIDDAKLRAYPSHTRLMVLVGDRDQVNDERMAIDLFNRIKLHEKRYEVLHSEDREGCAFVADHELPGHGVSHVLKYYGVYKPLDVLIDYSFTGRPQARELLYGERSDMLTEMGTWPDGRSYVKATSYFSAPKPLNPQTYFRNPWDDSKNERRAEGWE